MKKEEVFEILKTKGKFYCQEKQFIKKFPDIYLDICKIEFPKEFTLVQKMYHYFMNDLDLKLGLCPVCGKRCKFKNLNFGYWNHCSSECASIDEIVVDKLHNTNMNRYGCEWISQNSDVKKRIKETYMKHYGVEHPMLNDEFKKSIIEKIINSIENRDWDVVLKKCQETCVERYGVKNISEMPEIRDKAKETTLLRYGNVYYGKSEHYRKHQKEYTNKGFEARKKNHSCSTSKIEERISEYFSKSHISHIRQYSSELYPFHCDFYLPDCDLYIEIQGNWTHGFHPFDENNNDDIKTLNLWKEKSQSSDFYKSAIKVWTKSDVDKRNIAKKNRLNYLEIFSIDFDYCVGQILNGIKSGS